MSAIRSIHGKQRGGNFGCGPLADGGHRGDYRARVQLDLRARRAEFHDSFLGKNRPVSPKKFTYKSKQQNGLRP